MKIWGIIASILMVVFIGTTLWFYSQNSNLKSQKTTAETNLAAANSKKTAASKKLDVLSVFFSSRNSGPEAMLQAKADIAAMNNATLTADWAAMEANGGSDAGTKTMQDLVSAAQSDLK